MVQYKLKQRGFYYFNSMPALNVLCVEECVCVCARGAAEVTTGSVSKKITNK